MSVPTSTVLTQTARPGIGHRVEVRLVGALLALAVGYVHLKDQGGLPGEKDPSYIGLTYYALEVAAVVAALALVLGRTRQRAATWLLALGVGLGPVIGFVLSRGPGLPNYSDDKGNWTEQLGIISLVLEGLLIVVALAALSRLRRPTS